MPLPLNSKERKNALKQHQGQQVEPWRVSIFVTANGVETMAGTKVVLGYVLAQIEAERMERRQPAHLFPRSFVAPATVESAE